MGAVANSHVVIEPTKKPCSGSCACAQPQQVHHPLVSPTPLEGDDPCEHIKYQLGNTAKRIWPYPHFVCEDVFPKAFYGEMIRRFPADKYLPPLNDIYPKRLSLRIGVPDQLDGLPEQDRPFWRALGQNLGSRSFMRFVLRQFDPLMEHRFGEIAEPHIYLHSDVDSYGIGPHVDIHYKIVSLIFYLPSEERDDLNAASVLVKSDSHVDICEPFEEAWEGYTAAATVPFKPNILFTFAVTNESWHGVRPNPEGVPRRSLQYFIMLPQEAPLGC